MTNAVQSTPFGALLRSWRERRRWSQLELSSQAEVSTRHLSFVETGRSTPSREMVLRLAEHLDVPLRDRNGLLLAAGHAPVYTETGLDSPRLASVRAAVGRVLAAYEPYPAVLVDRSWNILDGNSGIALLTDGVAPELLAAPANALRISLHPDGMAPRIVNLEQWREHLLDRLGRQAANGGDPDLRALHTELSGYATSARPEATEPTAGLGDIAVPLRLRHDDGVLNFISTVTTFGAPLDVTMDELAIESFLPADEATSSVLREHRDRGRSTSH
ncbi:helix-turn-helix transcriptional regulator [Actinoalloteichus hymeniacidonis]|uniref:Transcriptional regulator n=1 Tax=Actinoalloteichus hymeniacidonis TaxID=340345 RepID=A0AAC9HQS5_9PSEU|nr:helix-turn-helix transcriptional regulator [Actinoalloteichus hymeniacidonis]AOS63912.1 putative transcriptional regulator [Actinoalloteichus hymeniacidonis]MBB5908032.1 transcriptional regulator with XRE-family HTH domain [Actinoalloteichus hymeniacidonis]